MSAFERAFKHHLVSYRIVSHRIVAHGDAKATALTLNADESLVIARVTGGVADDSRSDVDDTGHEDAPEDQLSVVVTRFIVVDAGSGQYRGAVGHEPSRGVAPATAQFVDDHRPTLLVTCPVLSQQRCTGTIYTAWLARS